MNSRTAVVTQPTYLPWLGYFEQIAQADVLVFLDTVQFERRSWQNRNRLRGSNGQPFWLTVPVQSHRRETPIRQIRISPQENWAAKHLASIQHALQRAPYFADIFPRLESGLQAEHELLADLNTSGIRLLADSLGLHPQIWRSSQLEAKGRKAELIVNICREVGATHYYTSVGAKDYVENEIWRFREASIDVRFQSWEHPVYPQTGSGFTSHLSAVDALMNIGTEATLDALYGQKASAGRTP